MAYIQFIGLFVARSELCTLYCTPYTRHLRVTQVVICTEIGIHLTLRLYTNVVFFKCHCRLQGHTQIDVILLKTKIYLGGKWKKRRSLSGTCKIFNHSLHFDRFGILLSAFVEVVGACTYNVVGSFSFISLYSFMWYESQVQMVLPRSLNWLCPVTRWIIELHLFSKDPTNSFTYGLFIRLLWFLVWSSFTVLGNIRKYCFYIPGTTWYGTIWNFAFKRGLNYTF